MTYIGKPMRKIIVEPKEIPIPVKEPERMPEPERKPIEQPEKVPA